MDYGMGDMLASVQKKRASRVLSNLFGNDYFVANKNRLLSDFAKLIGDPRINEDMFGGE